MFVTEAERNFSIGSVASATNVQTNEYLYLYTFYHVNHTAWSREWSEYVLNTRSQHLFPCNMANFELDAWHQLCHASNCFVHEINKIQLLSSEGYVNVHRDFVMRFLLATTFRFHRRFHTEPTQYSQCRTRTALTQNAWIPHSYTLRQPSRGLQIVKADKNSPIHSLVLPNQHRWPKRQQRFIRTTDKYPFKHAQASYTIVPSSFHLVLRRTNALTLKQ
jgi:hypothetical protein